MQENKEKNRLFVLPIDSSKHSERAFDWYLKNMYRPGDRVGIVHVHEPPVLNHEAFGVWGKVYEKDEYQKAHQKSMADSKSLVQKYEQKAADAGIQSETVVKLNQHGAGHTICDIAATKNADGIIMGSRGLNLFRRTLLGSVSSYVLNHANTTVTITPPEDAHGRHPFNVPQDDTDVSTIL